MYSIILPIKINETNSIKIFTEISLPLYGKFLNVNNLDYFYIICPKDNMLYLKKFTRFYSHIPFKFIEEEFLLGNSLNDVKGWYKQQIIKLVISLIVKTKYYLVLDSDLFLNQKLSYDDLFFKGKIKYSYEPYQEMNSVEYSTNSDWWKCSCSILNYNQDLLINEKHLMNVTPQLFITEKVRQLMICLFNSYGNDWQTILCDKKFTEYTLYWIYLIQTNQTSLYTTEGYPLWEHDLDRNILDYNSPDDNIKKINTSIDFNTSFFTVIQSYLPVDLQTLKQHIFSKIKVNYDAIFLVASMTKPNRTQFFNRDDRRQQTTDTLNSIKEKIPNSLCILIEGTELSDYERYEYFTHYDYVIQLGNDETVLPFINHPTNIGHGEMKLLERGINAIFEQILNMFTCSYVFKLSARYKLTEQFSLSNFDKDKYCFREHIDVDTKERVFTTALYNIPVKELENYRNKVLIDGQHVLSNSCSMVERLNVVLIPEEQIKIIETIGVEGRLSYNGNRFYL